jgi:hypothetical protein
MARGEQGQSPSVGTETAGASGAPERAGTPGGVLSASGEVLASIGMLHPTAARLVDQVRRSGEFTAETWRDISQAMDELSDTDLRAILEAVGSTVGPAARPRPT